METNLILTLSSFFVVLTCLMCICFVSKKSLCYEETKKENFDDRFHHLRRTSYFPETDESSNFENPELPYSYGPNHFQLGGFCMQWGYTTGSNIKFHFPFD